MFLAKRKIITIAIVSIITIASLVTFSVAKGEENIKNNTVKIQNENTEAKENITKIENKTTKNNSNNINVEYEYNEQENIVIAKMVSSIELKATKPTWTLSENKKEYTKIFTGNINYSTNVEDINGNVYIVNIVITQIQPLSIKISYEYNSQENIVIAKMTSNIELKATKPSWTLSENKKEYTKIFTGNMNYTTNVEDVNGSIYTANIVITQIEPLSIKIDYEYNAEENIVIAKMTSNIELKATKPSWTLSENKKEYTKIFTGNMNYTTNVEDVNGSIYTANIVITQIEPWETKIDYEYDIEKNIVTAKIISNTELKATKPTWTLSEDKKTYAKTFNENMDYYTEFENVNGEKQSIHIQVTDVIIANLKVEYQYNDVKNTVTVKVISDVELQATKPSWTLSEDKLVYTKEFGNNDRYSTVFVDCYNHNINVEINIHQIDKTPPQITLEYKYNKEDSVTISMKSNEKLGDTKPSWTLSEDKLTYSKVFGADEDYTTDVKDIYGNVTNVHIKLQKKRNVYPQADGSTITVNYMYTSYENVIVEIVSSVQLQDTKPSWTLSEDKYTYTKVFTDDIEYTTPVIDIYGRQKNVYISIDYFFKIIYETGTYGHSGAAVRGVAGGSTLQYLRFGNGNNVLFATFCVHGFEDSWPQDGTVLVDIADKFYNRLVSDQDESLAKKWTIYILREVNPDGRMLGTTNNGPGRTTLYSSIGRGMDINRCWQTGSSYVRFTDNRNYNGTAGFQAYESAYLRDFMLSHKSTNGQTVVVDLHGWEDQLIGNSQICNYYKQQFPSCSTRNYENYGTQYLITWARQNLGAKAALVELPLARDWVQVNNMDLSNKYINATLNMLRGI